MKIALIEDEESLRSLYLKAFQEAGVTLDGFASGEEGLAAVKQNAYDLVLLDIMLPGIDGLEVLKEIRQDINIKTTPVVLLTNLGQDVVIKQAFELGVSGYFIKSSISTREIIEEVKNVLQRKATASTE